MPTFREEDSFQSHIFNQLPKLLDSAMEWIAANMDPDEIFDHEKLNDWALDNGYGKPE